MFQVTPGGSDCLFFSSYDRNLIYVIPTQSGLFSPPYNQLNVTVIYDNYITGHVYFKKTPHQDATILIGEAHFSIEAQSALVTNALNDLFVRYIQQYANTVDALICNVPTNSPLTIGFNNSMLTKATSEYESSFRHYLSTISEEGSNTCIFYHLYQSSQVQIEGMPNRTSYQQTTNGLQRY